MEQNTAIVNLDEYIHLKKFRDTIEDGDHVKVRSSQYNTYYYYGNTEKISEELLKDLEQLRNVDNERKKSVDRLTDENIILSKKVLGADKLLNESNKRVKNLKITIAFLVVIMICQFILLI